MRKNFCRSHAETNSCMLVPCYRGGNSCNFNVMCGSNLPDGKLEDENMRVTLPTPCSDCRPEARRAGIKVGLLQALLIVLFIVSAVVMRYYIPKRRYRYTYTFHY